MADNQVTQTVQTAKTDAQAAVGAVVTQKETKATNFIKDNLVKVMLGVVGLGALLLLVGHFV